jgi:NAD(P)-dependent dehydrogenase (short-subunit alcohol dehydrogenase family)
MAIVTGAAGGHARGIALQLAGRGTDVEAFRAERTGRIPLGRRAGIEKIAAGVVWLALDAPDYVTVERLKFSGLDRD